MEKHYIDIDGRWAFVFAYDIGEEELEDIGCWLRALGCGAKRIGKALRVATATNCGFTFSNPDLKMSVMVISNASSPEQWWDTLDHEIDHLQDAICRYYDVPLGTEEAAYLQGYIMRGIFSSLMGKKNKGA